MSLLFYYFIIHWGAILEFLANYGLFLAESVTTVIAILIVVAGVVAISSRSKKEQPGNIEVTFLNDTFEEMEDTIKASVLTADELKAEHKALKKKDKAEKKAKKKKASEESGERRKRLYVISFVGDMKASAVENLREEITAVLTIAERQDEVLIKLESPGGLVHTYGLAASQLQRVTNKDIPLTIAVDAVAASGGYLMACIGNKILAAPFAIIGSIGVMAQLPNFHRLLKKNDIDFELFTAGEHKRTVTMFGENTDKGRAKFIEELEDTHDLFKGFVSEHRPQLNISEVATGEIWYGKRALEKNLIDDIQTSDEYLMAQWKEADIYSISYEHKKSLPEKLGFAAAHATDSIITRVLTRFQRGRTF
jgi:serine protease SohB